MITAREVKIDDDIADSSRWGPLMGGGGGGVPNVTCRF